VIYRLSLTVPGEAIDTNGHVNNVLYLRWMQDAAIAHAEATGGAAATAALGATWVVRSHHIEYLRPAFAGDVVEVHTWVTTLRRSSSQRRYRIVREDTLLARGETVWVFVDAATGKPRPIPLTVSGCFRLVPPEQGPTD
jgi:acyl-CoA thioester hydrolase